MKVVDLETAFYFYGVFFDSCDSAVLFTIKIQWNCTVLICKGEERKTDLRIQQQQLLLSFRFVSHVSLIQF